jgi:hypothetical protein
MLQSAAAAAVAGLQLPDTRSAAAGQVSVKDAVAGRLAVWMQQLQEQFTEVQQLLQQLQ